MFEEYLKDVHAQNYNGIDDDMQDSFELWLEELDKEELIALADKCLEKKYFHLLLNKN